MNLGRETDIKVAAIWLARLNAICFTVGNIVIDGSFEVFPKFVDVCAFVCYLILANTSP